MGRPLSIRSRLLIGLIGSLTLVLAASGGGLYWLQRELLIQEFDRQLDRRVFAGSRVFRRDFSEASEPDPTQITVPDGLVFIGFWIEGQSRPDRILPTDIALGDDFTVMMAEGDNAARITHVLPDGRSVRVSMRRVPFGPFRGDGRRDRRRDRTPQSEQPPGEGDGPQPNGDERRDPPREPRPAMFLVGGADLGPMHASLGQWLLILLGGGALAEALVITAVLVAVGRGLRPLRAMESDIAGIDDTDLSTRLTVNHLPSELRPLVGQLNRLLERMEGAFQREREFTSNAAHEFMTPLAGIRTQIEVALRRERSAAEYRTTLDQSLRATLALQRLVDLLLDLSRLDCGQVKVQACPFDAGAMVYDFAQQAGVTAAARNCTMSCDAPQSLTFNSDRQLFERIVDNLLGNAADYADPGSPISVSLAAEDDRLHLRVANAASGFSQADVERLGDRFWRKDTSRTETTRHCGLGLSIVTRCIHALQGDWHVMLNEGQVHIHVTIPQLDDN